MWARELRGRDGRRSAGSYKDGVWLDDRRALYLAINDDAFELIAWKVRLPRR